MVVIVDYGMGNLGSIRNMLKKIGVPALLSSDPAEIGKADKLILPGVGSFDAGMESLSGRGLLEALARKVIGDRTPIMGICLGMQLFARSSEEGTREGLGWLPMRCVRFRVEGAGLRVPHMGWNTVAPQGDIPLFRDMHPEPRFYFVHSYHAECDRAEDILATTRYGYTFPSVVGSGNILGVQFHPEKSHKFGMRLLKNFADAA